MTRETGHDYSDEKSLIELITNCISISDWYSYLFDLYDKSL